jgi:hypothetical protein
MGIFEKAEPVAPPFSRLRFSSWQRATSGSALSRRDANLCKSEHANVYKARRTSYAPFAPFNHRENLYATPQIEWRRVSLRVRLLGVDPSLGLSPAIGNDLYRRVPVGRFNRR